MFHPNVDLTFNGIHGVISQKTEAFRTTAVRTSDPTIGLLFDVEVEYKL
jgi:hypothetical protein